MNRDVTVTENGPYIVDGLPLKRRRIVTSEHGESLTWQTTEVVEADGEYALCRCGGSQHKPFCDGSHEQNGFDGTETAPTTSYDERSRDYAGTHIVMRDDRSLCVHAAFCTNRVSTVWKMVRAGDTEDSIARAQVMAMVERCPSGALTYQLDADGSQLEPELPDEVCIVDDGPLQVTGRVTITRSDGTILETRNRVTLCRCGASANKPLCDGSHRDVGFRDPAR